MYGKAASIFYGLSSFLLLTGLFIMSESQTPEVLRMQSQIKYEFSVAWQQTWGDQPYFDELIAVIEGVDAFYAQATDQTIALLEDNTGSDQDFAFVIAAVYNNFAQSFKTEDDKTLAVVQEVPMIDPQTFMSEEPLRNIVPEGSVAGVHEIFEFNTEPVNSGQPWVTVRDNNTGQLYCLAIYNGEVNKYLGECKYDYY